MGHAVNGCSSPASPPLPCPLTAGRDLVAEVRLPWLDGAGQTSAGFSAATYRTDRDELWLLSDAPMGQLVGWGDRQAGTRKGSFSPSARARSAGSDQRDQGQVNPWP